MAEALARPSQLDHPYENQKYTPHSNSLFTTDNEET